MSIAGSSSIRRLKDVAVVVHLHEFAPVGGRPASGRSAAVRAVRRDVAVADFTRAKPSWLSYACEPLTSREPAPASSLL